MAIITCMDSRIFPEELLGLRPGDAHVIRNAGGLATDDAVRSLVVSQHVLGTHEVLVIEHTECGMLNFPEEAMRRELIARTGTSMHLPFLGFSDLDANLKAQVDRLRSHPWVKKVPVHGLIYDVRTGRLREVL
jgi:carbonic anhydrase